MAGSQADHADGDDGRSTILGRDILIVDDIAANLVAMEAALEPLGCRVVKAASGQEALKKILDQDFAVVLLDVQMPEMDGYETATWIRSRQRTKYLPIIFVTAHTSEDTSVLRAYELGAVDFLFKPLQPQVLRAKTQAFVHLAEAQALRTQVAVERASNEALVRANEQLALADQRKNQFLAILGHELRNPLAPIRTSVDLMLRTPGAPVAPRLLEIMDRQLGHVTRIVDDLLDVARISHGKIDLRKEVLRLQDVVDEAVLMCRSHVHARNQRLTVRGADEPLLIEGDRTRIVQILGNLLTNATRYTPQDGSIDVEWGRRDGEVYLRVTDTGVGIAPEVLDRIFDIFVQERAESDGNGGLGLGLALAQQLARLHGGFLTATSAGKGKGSSFELRLPPVREDVVYQPRTTRQDVGRPVRALVVEDDRDIRELLAELLASYGHEVMTADDGPSGLELLCKVLPDVALVDIGLPGFDGCVLAQSFRDRCPGTPTRLVAMTGFGQEADLLRARDAGFDKHLVKPATTPMLLDALRFDDGDPSSTR
jgi:signal transduction histidine kinase